AFGYSRFLAKFCDSPNQGILALQDWVQDANQRMKTPTDRFLANYLANAPTVSRASATSESWRLPETISRPESVPFRVALTSARLRTYVDAWLETGRRADGSEWPAQRNLRNTFEAKLAFWDYGEKAPVKLMMSPGPGVFDVVGHVAKRGGYSAPVRDFFEPKDVKTKRLFFEIVASNGKNRLCKCRYH